MSVWLLDRGLSPIGALLAGALATWLGPQHAVAVLGALTVSFAVVLGFVNPRLRHPL